MPPVPTVKAARPLGPGSTVRVRAVVPNGPEMGNIRYIHDAEAGLALYAQPAKLLGYGALHTGDSIQVTGQLKRYNGLLKMAPVASFHKLAGGQGRCAVQVPAVEASTVFVEANEGRLLKIAGVTRLATPAGTAVTTLAGNIDYLLTGQTGTLVRVGAASTAGLLDATPPTEPFPLRGVLRHYSPSGTGGHHLLARPVSDRVLGGGRPGLTKEPAPLNVSATSFTVVHAPLNLNPGDTRVRYRLTPQDLKESRTEAAPPRATASR